MVDEETRGRHRIPEEDKKLFSKVIQNILKKTGLSQTDLAEYWGVSRSWVNRAKSGHFGPWSKSEFENKLQVLVEDKVLEREFAEHILAEFSINLDEGKNLPFLYIHRISAAQAVDDSKIILRSEVGEICKAIERGKKYVLILGPQASGKSTAAKQAIIRLLKNSHTGYLLNARHITDTGKMGISEELKRIVNDRRTVLLVEDAHTNPLEVSYLLDELYTKHINCIITSRPSYKHQLFLDQRNYLALMENGKIGEFFKFDPAGASYIQLMKRIIMTEFNEREIEIPETGINELIKECGGDLFALKFLLEATRNKVGGKELVYRHFLDRLTFLERQQEYSALAVAVVAAFWQYEIAINGRFLTTSLGIKKNVLHFLVDQGYLYHEVLQDIYTHEHPSVGKYFFETACRHPHLWSDIIPYPVETEPMPYLIKKLLEYDTGRIYQIFQQIRYNPSLVASCIKDQFILDAVFSHIHDRFEPLSKAADLISDIALYCSQETRDLLNTRLDIDMMQKKLNHTDDLAALAYFIESLPWEAKAKWTDTIKAVNEEAILVGINSRNCKDHRIVYCPFTTEFASRSQIKNELYKIATSNNQNESGGELFLLKDAQLCCKSGEVPTVCLKGTLHTPGALAIKTVQKLDKNVLAKKLTNPNTSLLQVAKLLSVLAWTDRLVYEDIISLVGIENLVSKIREVRNINVRNMILWAIQQANPLDFEDTVWHLLDRDVQNDYAITEWHGV